MLNLHARVIPIQAAPQTRSQLFRVSTNTSLPSGLRQSHALLVREGEIAPGFGAYLLGNDIPASVALPMGATIVRVPTQLDYLSDNDVVSLRKDSSGLRVIWRDASPHNSVLLTERCNNYCLMCSQPPKDVDDDWLIEEAERLIPLIPKSAPEIGFTGGEPTLYGERLITLLNRTKNYLPATAVHVLSNGRRFSDQNFAAQWASINHPDLMVGIPIYSDDPTTHDYVVQAHGAFDETVRGILNLKRLRQRVELRVVIHKQTITRLPQLAEWICRNLLFVDHVALMGLEMMGFARANLAELWVDPFDYKDTLSEAVSTLQAYGIPTSVYNHQLCTVNPDVLPAYRKSISDWKNEYLEACTQCVRMNECGGFFTSSKLHRHSDHIQPFLT